METLFGIPIGTLTAILTVVFLIAAAITGVVRAAQPGRPEDGRTEHPATAGADRAHRRRPHAGNAPLLRVVRHGRHARALGARPRGQAAWDTSMRPSSPKSGMPPASGSFIPAETADAVRSGARRRARGRGHARDQPVGACRITHVGAQRTEAAGAGAGSRRKRTASGAISTPTATNSTSSAIGQDEVYLSADAAEELGAGQGDRIALFFEETPVIRERRRHLRSGRVHQFRPPRCR